MLRAGWVDSMIQRFAAISIGAIGIIVIAGNLSFYRAHAQVTTPMGCIRGQERYDARVGRCRPITTQDGSYIVPPSVPTDARKEPLTGELSRRSLRDADELLKARMLECIQRRPHESRLRACTDIIIVFEQLDPISVVETEKTTAAIAYAARGSAYRSMAEMRSAFADFNRSIVLMPDPKNIVFCERAFAFWMMGQPSLGSVDNQKCLIHNPNIHVNWALQGHMSMQLGNILDAVQNFSRALSIAQWTDYFSSRGKAFFALGSNAEALSDFSVAIQLSDRENYAYYIDRGRVFAAMNRNAEAVQDYEKSIHLNPRAIEAYELRALAMLVLDQVDRALFDASRALELDPTSPSALAARGLARELKGDAAAAVDDYGKAIKGTPRDLHRRRDEDAQRISQERIATIAKERSRAEVRSRSGSGFFVSFNGHVLTNAHVIDGCRSVTVQKAAGSAEQADIITTDRINDLALLRSSSFSETFAKLSETARTGDPVAVYGFPLAGVLPSSGNFSLGNVSATAGIGDDTRMLQISAPVQSGNSGGPVLDQSGSVIGVVVSKLDAVAALKMSGDLPQNVNFAIKSSVAKIFLAANGVSPIIDSGPRRLLAPSDLADRAKAFTVFVRCQS